MQLSDAELCALFRGGDLGGDTATRVDFFNIHDRAARALLGAHAPFDAGDRRPHLVVMGLGQLGRSVVVAAAQHWADGDPAQPLRLSLIDRVATGRWEALCLQHPALRQVCAVTTLDLDLDAPSSASVERFGATLGDDPTWVAVLFDHESVALSAALLTRQLMGDRTVPVVVRTQADAGIGSLLEGSDDGTLPEFHVFPFLDRACTPEIVEGGVREQIARALHDDYLAGGSTGGLSRPWDDLSDDERESSRRAADDLVGAFESVGFDIIPVRHWGGAAVSLESPEVERLSEREHNRWLDERRQDGWTHGAVRDDAKKINPLLVDWSELDRLAKANQRSSVRALPRLLARAGFEPARRRT